MDEMAYRGRCIKDFSGLNQFGIEFSFVHFIRHVKRSEAATEELNLLVLDIGRNGVVTRITSFTLKIENSLLNQGSFVVWLKLNGVVTRVTPVF
ncbi:hypothetical protein HAX54_007674 [Datura stramonium]|uniref:Uncharacterized protein n=1 Tax=Datura stramonium TaxID=4076 RepID=A0ABS8TDM3_DATST|nr:hypothetical protein [Datura stramonium]